MASNTFTLLCNYPHLPSSENFFIFLNWNSILSKQKLPFSLPSPIPVAGNHPSTFCLCKFPRWLSDKESACQCRRPKTVIKNLPANAGDLRDAGLIPGSGRSLGEGNGNQLKDSCLENPMDRGAWRATVHGVAQRQAKLRWLSMHTARHLGRIAVFVLLWLACFP